MIPIKPPRSDSLSSTYLFWIFPIESPLTGIHHLGVLAPQTTCSLAGTLLTGLGVILVILCGRLSTNFYVFVIISKTSSILLRSLNCLSFFLSQVVQQIDRDHELTPAASEPRSGRPARPHTAAGTARTPRPAGAQPSETRPTPGPARASRR